MKPKGDWACEECGEGLRATARSVTRFCSPRCRQRASRRARALPQELTGRARWVRHSATKVPLTTGGSAASVSDPSSWSDFATAVTSRVGAGLGFVLAAEDDLVCIDLDGALDADGQPVGWARELLERAPSTWTEASPSGRGLHIWGAASFLGGRRLGRPGGGIEVYGSDRYITVTGRRYGRSPVGLADLTDLISTLV